MHGSFRLIALPAERFAPLFRQEDAELEAVGARRMIVDEKPEVSSPYRASGPIFIREGARTATPSADEIPTMFRHRLLSIRGYDAATMMVGAEVVGGSDLEETIRGLFADENVSYLHIHNARTGCYNCSVVRGR